VRSIASFDGIDDITVNNDGTGMASYPAPESRHTNEQHQHYLFIASDDTQEKTRVSAFIEILGLRPMDTGQLPMARTLNLFHPVVAS
jgi:predicted dinucleotide-binding enzyme